MFKDGLSDRMSGLVVGGGDALLFLDLARTLSAPETHLIARLFEVLHLDEIFISHGRKNGGFVDDCG